MIITKFIILISKEGTFLRSVGSQTEPSLEEFRVLYSWENLKYPAEEKGLKM